MHLFLATLAIQALPTRPAKPCAHSAMRTSWTRSDTSASSVMPCVRNTWATVASRRGDPIHSSAGVPAAASIEDLSAPIKWL